LKDDHRMRVFENSVLKQVFGPKRDIVTRERLRLYKGEFYVLYSSQSII
jgi:hypothetical protein